MRLLFLIILFGKIIILSQAQDTEKQYNDAIDQWQNGKYVEALTTFKIILKSAEADDYFTRIALQTGELFQVRELAQDGKNIRFSPDNLFAVYDRALDEKRFSIIYDLKQGKEISSIEGYDLLIYGNKKYYLQTEMNENMIQAIRQRDDAFRNVTSRAQFFQARAAYNRAVLINTKLFVEGSKSPAKLELGNRLVAQFVISPLDESLYFIGAKPEDSFSNIYQYSLKKGKLSQLTESNSYESNIRIDPSGSYLYFDYLSRSPIPAADSAKPEITGTVGIYNLKKNKIETIEGNLQAISKSGLQILILNQGDDQNKLSVVDMANKMKVTEIIATDKRIRDGSFSPNGQIIAFSMMEQDDYEIFTAGVDGGINRVSYEIQHDRFPKFLDENLVIAAKGEGRHRRSFMYELYTGQVTKLFHNNTVRTIAPEYQWEVDDSGTKILIISERDGNTISPERGVYLLDLEKQITKQQLINRIDRNLESEINLREKGERLYSKIKEDVTRVVSKASVHRVYNYESDLYKFASKHISQKGNDKASQYILATFKSFGYDAEFQWFTPKGRNVYDGKTANIIATLKGTVNPELVYVVSSHYDSVERGPGADDNTSGTSALLEAARIMANNPMPCTIMFLAFSGEEAGLLGSREFVRQAQQNGINIIGALNNDMVGWANDSRLDNTIRYSNEGIRDIQHSAASMFTNMVTYDALYYKSTDAHAYYEVYGDIVGGIGSYPVLGNPFYHQWNDNLETINHQLVTEVAKTTTATLMLLSSSPSRIKGLNAIKYGANSYNLKWTPSPENNVNRYRVSYQDQSGDWKEITINEAIATIENVMSNSTIKVKAYNSDGMEGWDWAKIEVE